MRLQKIEVTELREGTKVTQKRDTYTEPEEIKQIAEKTCVSGICNSAGIESGGYRNKSGSEISK